MKIYTRCGDGGETSLPGGGCVDKDSIRVECLGCLDELSAHIGVLVALIVDTRLQEQLRAVQYNLFDVGVSLSLSPDNELVEYFDCETTALEGLIDELSEHVPSFEGFVVAGGNLPSAQAHVCRTVCRRVERRLVGVDDRLPELAAAIRYVNRLSDWLFLVARYLENDCGKPEVSGDSLRHV